MNTIPVSICMGSSCFSRGNNRNIEVVMAAAADQTLPLHICPRGHLCEGRCTQGPNITIADRTYVQADPVIVAAALQEEMRRADKGDSSEVTP
jgi:NADH:ubiquinone oxidoreductase subunit E